MRLRSTCWLALVAVLTMSSAVLAGPPHFEGFEDSNWTPGGDNWNNYLGGDIQRVTSGTNGISSASGAAHAVITNLSSNNNVFDVPTLGALSPYTRFDGYTSSFAGGFVASLDVYLDTAWADGQGFDYSVAASRQDGSHLRDFVWHVGIVGTDLLVNASNNSDRSYNAWKLQNENGGDNFTVAVNGTGWYTLENVFYDDGGTLSVDFNLRNSGGGLIYSVTRTTGDDIASTVGGNRYGWLVYNNVDGLAVDNTVLEGAVPVIPVPAAGLAGMGLLGLIAAKRRRVG